MSVLNRWSIRGVIPCLLVSLSACGPIVLMPSELLDGARKSEDIALFLAVQRADQLSSGNATLGEAGPIGKLGSVRLSARASMTRQATPDLSGVPISTESSESSTIPVSKTSATSLVVDGAFGVWRGIRIGETYFGGLNVLGRVALLSRYGDTPLDVSSDDNLAFGFGFRMGILEESARTPGIAVSWMAHGLPAIAFGPDPLQTTAGGAISLALRSTDMDARQFRIAASKEFGAIGVTAGYGSNSLTGTAAFSAVGLGTGTQPAHSWENYIEVERRLMFAGVSYRTGPFTFAGEAGRLTGDAPFSSNDFADQGDWARNYLSVGVRVGR
jgi:hypothetical protein